MTVLAVVGAVVITAALIYMTWAFFGLLYVISAIQGWDKDARVYTAFIGFGWILTSLAWWFIVGTHIHIGVS